MPIKNGLARKIVAFVQATPGCTGKELGAALGFKHGSGQLTYMRLSGMIHGSGPRHWTRYYPTAEAAAANHDRIAAEAVAVRTAKAERAQKDAEGYRAQRRHAAAAIRKAAKIEQATRIATAKAMLGNARNIIVPPTVKITIAQTPPPRFAPGPGWVGAISSDHVARRQGAQA